MAQIRKPAVTPKVYRHFAAITVATTLMLGFFANGEGRQALADEVAQQQRHADLREAQIARFGQPKLIKRHPRRADDRPAGDGEIFDTDYGVAPGDNDTASVSGTWQGTVNPDSAMPGSYAPYGISQAQWDAMSEEQREAFLHARIRPQPAVSTEERQRAVEHLLAASADRAGQSGASDD